MFVAIENYDMNIHRVLEWINDTKKANNNVISPEFAMEILGKTNFYGHIKTVLKNIKGRCKTKEDILPYKEFILSCVDGREMSDEAMEVLQELAKLCGCKDEFDVIRAVQPKVYDKNECDRIIVKTKGELEALEGEDLRVFFDANEIDLSRCDFDKIKKIRFRDGAKVNLWSAKKLPEDLDLSMCSKVILSYCNLDGIKIKFGKDADVDLMEAENLPTDLDVSMCSKVNLNDCDLTGFNLKFKEGAEVYLNGAGNLPKELDVSMCSKVDLSGCNLNEGNPKFREGAEVYLSGAKNLPKVLDLSMCSKVNMKGCDLSGVEKIKFREGAEINLMDAVNLPQNFDLSMCSKVNMSRCNLKGISPKFRDGGEVNLSCAYNLPKDLDISQCSCIILYGCDLSGVDNIKFREGAKVDLSETRKLPKVLDLSMCSEVNLRECNLSGVEMIRFRDEKQEKTIMKNASNFTGKVKYKNFFSKIGKVFNVEM